MKHRIESAAVALFLAALVSITIAPRHTLQASYNVLAGITGSQGNGALLQRSTGSTTTNNCVKFDANGNTVDAAAACGPTTNQNIREINFLFDGGGSALSGTSTRCRYVNFAGTIQQITVTGDQSGSATVKILSVSYASYTGPGSASDISSGGESLSSVTKLQDSTLTGWTTSFSPAVVCAQISSPATFTWLSGTLKVAAN